MFLEEVQEKLQCKIENIKNVKKRDPSPEESKFAEMIDNKDNDDQSVVAIKNPQDIELERKSSQSSLEESKVSNSAFLISKNESVYQIQEESKQQDIL